MNARRLALAAVLSGAMLLGGCTGAPEPVETTPAFASEEEAFAAAEATYRAYVDALNQVDLSDPETFEPVFALTTGDANANARETFSEMHASGWAVEGVSAFDGLRHGNYTTADGAESVEVEVCLDVTDVRVVDESGVSVVPSDRPNRQPAVVTISRAHPDEPLRIESSQSSDSDVCAS